MALGKMNTRIEIVTKTVTKNAASFATKSYEPIASVRSYYEPKDESETWKGLAVFATAAALFKFRRIPGVTVTTAHFISPYVIKS